MIPQTRKYFVVTVHYEREEKTNALLSSIQKNTRQPHKVIIIDHGSTPFTPLVKGLPLTVIRPTENSGYGGGINTAAGHLYGSGAQGEDVIICVNNDIELAGNAIATIANAYQHKPPTGLWGALPATLNLFSGRTVLGGIPFWPWQKLYIDGACFAVDLQTFFAVKGMPDQLFMYWEDVEFSRRVKASGYTIGVIPHLEIKHHSASGYSPEKTYYLVRNGAWYLANQTPRAWRIYWNILNTIRRLAHTYITGKTNVVKALEDAQDNKLGK